MHMMHRRHSGQGMTEYIIIVALIAVAAIGIYTAFGDIVRGQTSVAASALAGGNSGGARNNIDSAHERSNAEGQKRKTLKDFEQ